MADRERLDCVTVMRLCELNWSQLEALELSGRFPTRATPTGNAFWRDEIENWIAKHSLISRPPVAKSNSDEFETVNQSEVRIAAAGLIVLVGSISFCIPWEIIHRAEESRRD